MESHLSQDQTESGSLGPDKLIQSPDCQIEISELSKWLRLLKEELVDVQEIRGNQITQTS